MLHRTEQLTREEECDRILQSYGPNFDAICVALDRQFRTIHDRAQVLLAICGVLISAGVLITTGKIIGRPSFAYQHVAGIVLVMAGILEITAAAVVVAGVLRVRWITQQPGADLREWVMSNLSYRDEKTRVYRAAAVLVLLSMVAYQAAIAIALLQL